MKSNGGNYFWICFYLSQTVLALYLSVKAFEAWNDAPIVTSGAYFEFKCEKVR